MRALLLLSLATSSAGFVSQNRAKCPAATTNLPSCRWKRRPESTCRLNAIPIPVIPDLPVPEELAIVAALNVAANQAERFFWNSTKATEEKTWSDDVDIKEIFLYSAIHNVDISCKVYVALLLTGLASPYLDFLPFRTDTLQESALVVSFIVWLALAASTVKRVLFLQLVSGKSLGRAVLYDRLIDFSIWFLASMELLRCLGIDLDTSGIQTMFAAGGVGALAISLASKSLLENIVGGITLQAYNGFNVGDRILLSDGTEGFVTKIGMVETEIVGYDNIAVKVPNSKFGNQRISNLSNVNQSRVKQTLRFKYSDLKKLKSSLELIKLEIERSCPKLINDGSKPFIAALESYEVDHLMATVVCHFRIPPRGEEYILNKQEVLFAIARALDANGVEFALPSIVYRTASQSNHQQQQILNDFSESSHIDATSAHDRV